MWVSNDHKLLLNLKLVFYKSESEIQVLNYQLSLFSPKMNENPKMNEMNLLFKIKKKRKKKKEKKEERINYF